MRMRAQQQLWARARVLTGVPGAAGRTLGAKDAGAAAYLGADAGAAPP